MHTSKTCSYCKESKPLSEFSTRKGHKGKVYPQSRCKPCVRLTVRESKERLYPTKEAWNRRMSEYRKTESGALSWFRTKAKRLGLSPEEVERAVASYVAHEGECEICKRDLQNIYIDHCHDTMTFRGLLCGQCNTMLGYAYDKPDVLIAGAAYLQEAKRQGKVEA